MNMATEFAVGSINSPDMILCSTLIKSPRAIFSAVMSATELKQQSSMLTLSSVSFL